MGDRRVISDREYAEKYRFGQVGRLTRDYEDALKRVREDNRKAANRLAQAERLRRLFEAAPHGTAA
jgi:hypothetical protein